MQCRSTKQTIPTELNIKKQIEIRNECGKYTLPILISPLLLNNVPKCGPDNERNVCNRGKIGRSCGLDNAERTIIVPNECATNDIRDGFKPQLSI